MSITKLEMPDLSTTDTWVRDFKCPTCGTSAVFLATGNYLTCSFLECPNPDVARAVNDLVATDKDTSNE